MSLHQDNASTQEERASAPRIGRTGAVLPLVAAALLAAVVCAAFTAAAAILLWGFLMWNPALEPQEFVWRLALKGGAACVLLLISLAAFCAIAARLRMRHPPALADAAPVRRLVWLVPAVLFAAALLFPNLGDYPRAAPDELHHLVVAKNLSQHGLYASGHPEKGFNVFDPFDSVGAPVILPVAGMFRLFGVGIVPARLVIAVYFLALCVVVWFLAAPVFGPGAATGAAVLMTLAYSSLYLGRTVYGEAPGLFYVTAGLLIWRRALSAPCAAGWAFCAGIAFGLAILCKTVLLLSAFAVVGAVLLDWLTYKRIRWVHLLFPAAGVLAVTGGWFAVQACFDYGVSENAGGTLGLYRQYLLPGVSAALENAAYIVKYPYAHAVALSCAAFVFLGVFQRRYDPPIVVLLLVGVFYAYWWLAFTPGRHVRYLWYGYAVAGLCSGIVAASFLAYARTAARGWWRRAFCAAAALAAAGPWFVWGAMQTREIFTNEEMSHDHALAKYVMHLPAGARLGSTYYPVRGTILFLTGRWVDIDEDRARLAGSCDVVIDYRATEPDDIADSDGEPAVFGPYRATSTREVSQTP